MSPYNKNLKDKVIYYPGRYFDSISKSKDKIRKLKKFVDDNKKIIIFKNVINKKIITGIEQNRNSILRNKPLFFKTFLGSDDLYIFNRENKKSHVKGYFKKIELYPWNKKNIKTYKSLHKIIRLKCLMDNFNFNQRDNVKFFDKKKFVKLQLNHYPAKKGYLRKHIDGIHKNFTILHIGMSKKSNKKNNSGLVFYFKNEKINMDKYLGLGDVAIFNPIVPHEVTPSNIKKGRWSLLVSSGHFDKVKGTKLQSKQIN